MGVVFSRRGGRGRRGREGVGGEFLGRGGSYFFSGAKFPPRKFSNLNNFVTWAFPITRSDFLGDLFL